jgi:putative phosphonoacetaldehyde dehydrogenase
MTKTVTADARGASDPNAVLRESMRIGGQRVDAEEVIPVYYPYSTEIIGTVPAGRSEHVRKAFAIAARYHSRLTRYERQRILLNTAEIIQARRDELSDLITLELGISKKDSLYECGRAFDVFTLAGQLAILDDGQIFSCDLTPHGRARKIYTRREPVTAIAAITPFNHPLNMVAHKVAPAIATNNCVVCKPTERTPLSAVRLADILYEAGLPPEMFQVVTGWPRDVGDEMVTNAHAEIITFTGGVTVGRIIAAKTAGKRAALELGGNDPLIVCDDLSDGDLDAAADLAVAGATRNSGQRCTAVKRILVMERVADKFSALVLDRARRIRFGNPMDPAIDLGTVVDEEAARIFEQRAYDAAEKGARILYDPGRQGAVLPPITLDFVPHQSQLVLEETFGPVIPMIRVPNIDDEVIAIANSTPFGLSSGVCTNRLDRVTRYVDGLKVGSVNIWEVPGYRTEMSPFGGIKESGNGVKEGVMEAMKFFTNVKTYSLPWPG